MSAQHAEAGEGEGACMIVQNRSMVAAGGTNRARLRRLACMRNARKVDRDSARD